MEEAGELAQLIGKFRGLSGEATVHPEHLLAEDIAGELLDVAQTAVTMMFVMEEAYGISLDDMLQQHVNKLEKKGYLRI